MDFYFADPELAPEELRETMQQAADVTAANEGFDPDALAVSVSFVDAARIRELNRSFRGIDRVTDVLSFPQFENADGIREAVGVIGAAEIGDVVICLDQAEKQAREFGHSTKREIIYLFVHSLLHLFGYDHEEKEEKRVMRAREEAVMNELGIPRRTDDPEEAAEESEKDGKPVGAGEAPANGSSPAAAETAPLPDGPEEQARALFRAAESALPESYAPYSHFRVGAAILAENEKGERAVFTGGNVENASYGASICAERAACVKAVNAGCRKLLSVAVASTGGEAPMCGICRQFLSEFGPDMTVVTGADETHLHVRTLRELLPSQFTLLQDVPEPVGRKEGKA